MTKFQIRNGGYGHTLVDAETARDALLTFLTDRARARFRDSIQDNPDGSASVTVTDVVAGIPTESRFYAVSFADVQKQTALDNLALRINAGQVDDEQSARQLAQLGATDADLEAAVARMGG